MKIEEINGHRVVVFEDGVDDALKKNFFGIIAQEQPLREAALQATEELEAARTVMKAALMRLELFRTETRDQLWTPVERAVQELLNTEDDVHMVFNSITNQIRLEKKEEPKPEDVAVGVARGLARFLSALRVPIDTPAGADVSEKPDDDDGKLVH